MKENTSEESLTEREVLDSDRSGVLVVDVQDSFLTLLENSDPWVNRLSVFLQIPKRLEIPILVTEQSPDKLGPTEETITEAVPEAPIVSKEKFNCFSCEEVLDWCGEKELDQILITGLMTNVCVMQSAFLGVDQGYNVHVAADGCRAESVDDHGWALQRMERTGISVTTYRTVAYGWLRRADHPAFTDLLPVLKQLGEF